MMTEKTTSFVESTEVSATLEAVTHASPPSDEPIGLDEAQREAITQMVRQAKDADVAWLGWFVESVDSTDRQSPCSMRNFTRIWTGTSTTWWAAARVIPTTARGVMVTDNVSVIGIQAPRGLWRDLRASVG